MRLILSMIFAALVVGLANGASAATFVVQGTVTEVVPNTVQVQIPDNSEQCETIDVPIFGQSSSNGDPVVGNILGAIVGGVVGNQFGGGNSPPIAKSEYILNRRPPLSYKSPSVVAIIMSSSKLSSFSGIPKDFRAIIL